MITLPDIFKISKLQTAGDFHFRIGNILDPAAISTPAIHRNARSRIRVNRSFSDDFLFQVGLHESFVLSPLLLIIVLRQMRQKYPELLYADDLVLVCELLEDLKRDVEDWE